MTGISTKCNNLITKYKKSLLQNASDVLLQNPTVLLQNVSVYQFYYKMCQNTALYSKCDVYCKIRRYKGSVNAIKRWRLKID